MFVLHSKNYISFINLNNFKTINKIRLNIIQIKYLKCSNFDPYLFLISQSGIYKYDYIDQKLNKTYSFDSKEFNKIRDLSNENLYFLYHKSSYTHLNIEGLNYLLFTKKMITFFKKKRINKNSFCFGNFRNLACQFKINSANSKYLFTKVEKGKNFLNLKKRKNNKIENI